MHYSMCRGLRSDNGQLLAPHSCPQLAVRAKYFSNPCGLVRIPSAGLSCSSPSPQPGRASFLAAGAGVDAAAVSNTGRLLNDGTVGRKKGAASGFFGGWMGLPRSCSAPLAC